MTHSRPLPDAAQAPWPAQPAAIDKPPEPPAASEGEAAGQAAAGPSTLTKIGVGAAIGSAAIAAALLYVNHGRKR